jgi:hypothetical protein
VYTAADIRARAQTQPFTPFRITTSAGESFDVTHPDLIWIGRREVQIGIARPEEPDFYDRVARLSILHITSMIDLSLSAPTPSGAA